MSYTDFFLIYIYSKRRVKINAYIIFCEIRMMTCPVKEVSGAIIGERDFIVFFSIFRPFKTVRRDIFFVKLFT